MTTYNFGGVFGGNVNIVQNGVQFVNAVDESQLPEGVGDLLKELRLKSDESSLDDGDKAAIAGQLAAILAELKKPAADKGRLEKALNIIKAAAATTKDVLEVAAKLAPLLGVAFVL